MQAIKRVIFETIPPIAAILAWVAAFVEALQSGNVEEVVTIAAVPAIVFVVQFLKQRGLRGEPLKWMAYVLSFVFAVVILLVTGDLPFELPTGSPAEIIASVLGLATVAAATATLIYEAVADKVLASATTMDAV